jgi:transcriptional regulator with XRE-family HTH domain
MARNAKRHMQPVLDTTDMTPRELTKQEFGRRLQALMLKKRWNQSELARSADLGRDAISTYIRGTSFPEPKNLQKLAEALEVEVEDLLPNAVVRAMETDQAPMLEIRQAAGHPDKVWMRVNRMVPMEIAVKIFNILNEADKSVAA